MSRSLGDKRRYLTDDMIADLTKQHGRFAESPTSKLLDDADFGYRRITVERPLRLRFQVTIEAKEKFLDACPGIARLGDSAGGRTRHPAFPRLE